MSLGVGKTTFRDVLCQGVKEELMINLIENEV